MIDLDRFRKQQQKTHINSFLFHQSKKSVHPLRRTFSQTITPAESNQFLIFIFIHLLLDGFKSGIHCFYLQSSNLPNDFTLHVFCDVP